MSDDIFTREKTKTERTQIKNLKMYGQHIRKGKQELWGQGNSNPSLVDIIQYYIERFATLRTSTMSNYRANLTAGLRWSIQEKDVGHEALELLLQYKPREDKNRIAFNEAGGVERLYKKKCLGKKNVVMFKRVCAAMTIKSADRLISYFNIATHTGLRPSEWANAKLVDGDDCVMLEVLNGKSTNGRSFGDDELYRYLILDQDLIEDAQCWLDYVRHAVSKYVKPKHQSSSEHRKEATDTLYRLMGVQITKAVKKLELNDEAKKLMPTFYTTRHYFTDVAIASKLSRVEIAYLLGHGSVLTHLKHYGRANTRVRNKIKVRRGRKGGGFPQKLIDSEKEFLTNHPVQASQPDRFGWATKNITAYSHKDVEL